MDCLNVQGSKINEPALLGNPSKPRSETRRSQRLRDLALFLLFLLWLVVLALVIWVAVENHRNRRDLDTLTRAVSGTTQSGSAVVTTASTGDNATLASVSAVYPAVYLSQNASAQPGYAYAGSLYRSAHQATSPSSAQLLQLLCHLRTGESTEGPRIG